MDFTQAALLIGAVYAITRAVDLLVPQATGWILQVIALVVGVGVTFLVALSDYGNTQTVSGIKVSDLNAASLILIGLLLGGGASVVHNVFTSISNVGENQP